MCIQDKRKNSKKEQSKHGILQKLMVGSGAIEEWASFAYRSDKCQCVEKTSCIAPFFFDFHLKVVALEWGRRVKGIYVTAKISFVLSQIRKDTSTTIKVEAVKFSNVNARQTKQIVIGHLSAAGDIN